VTAAKHAPAVRRALLDAARELLRSKRWHQITMAEVAKGAGVSRQTIYNEFGGRAAFAQAYVLDDADRILTAVEASIEMHAADPAQALRGAFATFLDVISVDPLAVGLLTGNDDDNLLALVTTQGGPVLAFASYRLSAAISAHWPQAPTLEVAQLADLLVRMALSHVALPGDTPEETADALASILGPFATEVLARSAE
jgi:AcrR family transcriptional regulator